MLEYDHRSYEYNEFLKQWNTLPNIDIRLWNCKLSNYLNICLFYFSYGVFFFFIHYIQAICIDFHALTFLLSNIQFPSLYQVLIIGNFMHIHSYICGFVVFLYFGIPWAKIGQYSMHFWNSIWPVSRPREIKQVVIFPSMTLTVRGRYTYINMK